MKTLAIRILLKVLYDRWQQAEPDTIEEEEAYEEFTNLEDSYNRGCNTLYNIYHDEFKTPQTLKHIDSRFEYEGYTFYVFQPYEAKRRSLNVKTLK